MLTALPLFCLANHQRGNADSLHLSYTYLTITPSRYPTILPAICSAVRFRRTEKQSPVRLRP
jgi:hypothetical protein